MRFLALTTPPPMRTGRLQKRGPTQQRTLLSEVQFRTATDRLQKRGRTQQRTLLSEVEFRTATDRRRKRGRHRRPTLRLHLRTDLRLQTGRHRRLVPLRPPDRKRSPGQNPRLDLKHALLQHLSPMPNNGQRPQPNRKASRGLLRTRQHKGPPRRLIRKLIPGKPAVKRSPSVMRGNTPSRQNPGTLKKARSCSKPEMGGSIGVSTQQV